MKKEELFEVLGNLEPGVVDTFFCIRRIPQNILCNGRTVCTIFHRRLADRCFVPVPVHLDNMSILHMEIPLSSIITPFCRKSYTFQKKFRFKKGRDQSHALLFFYFLYARIGFKASASFSFSASASARSLPSVV